MDMKALKEALEKCVRERDALAHGVWVKDRETGKIFLRLISGTWQPPGTIKGKVKRRIDIEAEEYTSNNAKETRRLIDGVLDALGELDNEIASALERRSGQ